MKNEIIYENGDFKIIWNDSEKKIHKSICVFYKFDENYKPVGWIGKSLLLYGFRGYYPQQLKIVSNEILNNKEDIINNIYNFLHKKTFMEIADEFKNKEGYNAGKYVKFFMKKRKRYNRRMKNGGINIIIKSPEITQEVIKTLEKFRE